MLPNNIRDLIDALYQRTIENKIIWTKTSRETEYQWTFNGGSITTDYWLTSNIMQVDLAVYNKDGLCIDRFICSESDYDFSKLNEFYTTIQKAYLKTDETYSNLFKELNDLE